MKARTLKELCKLARVYMRRSVAELKTQSDLLVLDDCREFDGVLIERCTEEDSEHPVFRVHFDTDDYDYIENCGALLELWNLWTKRRHGEMHELGGRWN